MITYTASAEFYFSLIKSMHNFPCAYPTHSATVSLIIALLLAGLIVDLGGGPNHERVGFRVCRLVYALNSPLDNLQYWKYPGPFNRAGLVESNINTDRFLAFLSVIVLAAYSYGGMELVAM